MLLYLVYQGQGRIPPALAALRLAALVDALRNWLVSTKGVLAAWGVPRKRGTDIGVLAIP